MHFVHVAVARVGGSLGGPVHPLEVASVGRTDRSGRTEGFTHVSLSQSISRNLASCTTNGCGFF